MKKDFARNLILAITLFLTHFVLSGVSVAQPATASAALRKPAAETPIAAQKPIALKNPVAAENPIAVKKKIAPENPVTAQKPIDVKKAVTAENPVTVEKPLAVKKNLTAEKPIAVKDPLAVKKNLDVDVTASAELSADEIAADDAPPADDKKAGKKKPAAKSGSDELALTAAELKEQDEILRRAVMDFVKDNQNRQAGEGWLYLAHHYRELKKPERSLAYLKTLRRSEHLNPRLLWEALLLNADILKDQKDFAGALKNLDELIAAEPARSYLVRAKIARAELFGRNLTGIKDIWAAFQRYYQGFPEKPDAEAIDYLMGFERGYDLEIAMRALTAWEEIAAFPEVEASNRANLQIAMLHSFDLNNPARAIPFIEKIADGDQATADAAFLKAVIKHFYLKDNDYRSALENYGIFRKKTDSLLGYRVAGILQGQLLSENLNDSETAVSTLQTLLETPPHLVASESVSLLRRREARDEEIDWGMLACRMAGFICEFRMQNLERARYFYKKIEELNKDRSKPVEDPVNLSALARTAPGATPGDLLFDMAFEKYRSHKMGEALQLYEQFIASYPESGLFREALFRVAVITDDDLRQYEEALKLYQRYLIKFAPVKSAWNLDVLYDWGRIDEVRYRIGNLQALHLKNPVEALAIFEQLGTIYPDSYWAMQGLKDSIRIFNEDLSDPEKANKLMFEFISRYPDSKEAADYRLVLFKVLLAKDEQVPALQVLRDYLDHAMPSEKDYFSLKQQWRDLAYKIREDSLRKVLKTTGARDRLTVYQNLVDVVCLASTSAPLESLVEEIKTLQLDETTRWSLVYDAGTRMYQNFPGKAVELFTGLAANATGTPQLACLMTLGNIAWRVDKDVEAAVRWYQRAEKLMPLTDARAEIPAYRLGRLYLVQGHGLKGLEKLRLFTARFPHSRYLARAYMAMGDACVALYSPEKAVRYYKRVSRLSPNLAEEVARKIADLEGQMTSQQWLKKRAAELKERYGAEVDPEEAASPVENSLAEAASAVKNADRLEEEDLAELPVDALYGLFIRENAKKAPAGERLLMFLHEILMRPKVAADLRQRAVRQYISTGFFRFRNAEQFVEKTAALLQRHNYADWQSELLFRMAQTQDHYLMERADANKSYFEYLSFYPAGKRVETIRCRIPAVYALADDKKNAYRFYEKLISDGDLPDEIRVDASMQMAKLQVVDGKKSEAIKTLEASLAFKSLKHPEICLRLEKLSEDFTYVKRALEAEGDEAFRLKALTRLVKKAEEDRDYTGAAALLRDFADTFALPESTLYIEKKVEELGKRGAIEEIENLIDQFPEEPETAGRMFKLAKMVEGAENTRYRSEDLFYEITLVYPGSEFYRESRIRAENTRAINALSELGDMLKKGVEGSEGEEVLLERARLLKENLKDLAGASENYESFIKLFPNSPRLDEVYLNLGEIVLAETGDSDKAFSYWEAGLAASRDPFLRENMTDRINKLKKFRQSVLFSQSEIEHEKGMREVFRLWKIEKNRIQALGLLENAILKLENRPDVAKMRYYAARIFEESGNYARAAAEYEKALRSLYHPGCRKDMVLYRLARLSAAQKNDLDAAKWYTALVSRYPRSMLSRSGFYWLSKYVLKKNNFSLAHHYLEALISFRSLHPLHREAVIKQQRDIEARLNVDELEKLKAYSSTGGTDLPYFIGKVLENSLRDYDRAITQYENFLATNPPVRRSREILKKIADLYEKKGDYVKTVSYLDLLLNTYEPDVRNFDLIIRIGSLVEDKLAKPELTQLFFSSIAAEYKRVPKVRAFAEAKLRRLEEKKRAKVVKTGGRKVVKRVYSEDDDLVVEEMQAIVARQVEDLQDFKQAERQLEDLWNENSGSLATLDIMKTLYELNNKQLSDPQKAATYMQRWLDENPNDPLVKQYTLKLYEHYMEVLRDGQKALRLLEDYVREHPISIETLDIELKLALANELLIRNFDEARRGYQRIIDTQQNDPVVHEAYFRIGYVYREGYANYDEAVKNWQTLIDKFYNNEFADQAQFAIAYTYEAYRRDYTSARQNYEKILQLYPNSTLQTQARDALLRIEGK
ncbi:MAG TPA: tetratricopeptide repeat protein [Candidatus Rifleibacterium sp.]|nr:tetratricopeptide repeat protein [Candidatus Rifleibacterium sp.]